MTAEEINALIEQKLWALWLAEKPSLQAQAIRADLANSVDDARSPCWLLDHAPEYVWRLVDIAAQRGLNFSKENPMTEKPTDVPTPEPNAIRVRGVVRVEPGEVLVEFTAVLSDAELRAFTEFVEGWNSTAPSQ